MKVGIVTIFNVPNYGAMLQCWSLCKAIKHLGHEPVLIHIPLIRGGNSPISKIRNLIKYRFKQNFIEHNLPFTDNLSTEVDAYIVGSDQVWNPNIVGNQLDKFLVSFAKDNTPIASFASSFGVEDWPLDEKKEAVKAYLSKFKFISVREKSGVEILKSTFGLEAEEALDPCFLTSDYSSLYVKDKNPSDVVFFKLQPWKDNLYKEAKKEAKKRNLKLYNVSLHFLIPQLNKSIKGFNESYYSVATWLKKISSAKYVITDSFHGMVFSLIFKRQFVVVNSKPQAITRMESLLSKLGLSHRIVSNAKEAFEVISNDEIDYNIVAPKLDQLKKQSDETLQKIIEVLSQPL